MVRLAAGMFEALFKECCLFLDSCTSPVCAEKVLRFPANAKYEYEMDGAVGNFQLFQGSCGVFVQYKVDTGFVEDENCQDLEHFKAIFYAFQSHVLNKTQTSDISGSTFALDD